MSIIRMWASAVLLAIVASGCGGGGSAATPAPVDSAPSVTDSDIADMEASTLIIGTTAIALSNDEHAAFDADWRQKKFDLARTGQTGGSVEYSSRSDIAKAHVDIYLLAVHRMISGVRAIHKIDAFAVWQKMTTIQSMDNGYYPSNCSGLSVSAATYCADANFQLKTAINKKYNDWYAYALGI